MQRLQESRRVLSGDDSYDKTINSRRHEQARFGPLPGYNKGPLVERSADLLFCLMKKQMYRGPAAPTPLGASPPDSLGGSLLEFLQQLRCAVQERGQRWEGGGAQETVTREAFSTLNEIRTTSDEERVRRRQFRLEGSWHCLGHHERCLSSNKDSRPLFCPVNNAG